MAHRYDEYPHEDPMANQEMRLWNDADEREKHETLADLFSIVKTCEHLEKAYVRDSVTAKEYEVECKKLIAKFKTIKKMMENEIPDVSRDFIAKYNLHRECPAACHRLLHIGVPATAEHGGGSDNQQLAVHAAQTVQHFITLMDCLELQRRDVIELFPNLRDLCTSLNKVALPSDYEGKDIVQKWLSKLNTMEGSAQISEDEATSMLHELEKAYSGFHKVLESGAES